MVQVTVPNLHYFDEILKWRRYGQKHTFYVVICKIGQNQCFLAITAFSDFIKKQKQFGTVTWTIFNNFRFIPLPGT